MKITLSSLAAAVLFYSLSAPFSANASIKDFAVYLPATEFYLTVEEQTLLADYLLDNVDAETKTLFSGENQAALVSWLSERIADGNLDVLIIAAAAPAELYKGQIDGSLAEEWMESGNMLVWTGSEPFSAFVNIDESISQTAVGMGASNVLDVSTSNLCTGRGLQELSSAASDYGLAGLPEYNAQHALKYDQILIDAESSNWNSMSYWRVEEIFSEDSEARAADNLVLVNDDGGRFAVFMTVNSELDGPDGAKEANYYRMRTLTQFFNNWVSLPRETIFVPDQYASIQAAIDAANPGDVVVVRAGTYFEALKMKKGVKVVSDASGGGNELIEGPGYAYAEYGVESKKALKRAMRTIIDGTGLPGGQQAAAMVDFPRGATVGTMLDGFTVRNMPDVDHTIPGHSHVLQFRGASGTVVNCLVHDNGSSGMGSHAWFFDQQTMLAQRDFRYENVEYDSHPIIVNNIVYRNKGNNLGNNHYAYAIMFNNEVFESISIAGRSAPGIGNQHGAAALIVGNLVYKNAWSGISAEKGEDQGLFQINRPTRPTVRGNRVFDSGRDPAAGISGTGISSYNSGGLDPKTGEIAYHTIEENIVAGAANAAIGARSSEEELGFVKISGNEVSEGGAAGLGAGIELMGASALVVSNNTVHDNTGAGIDVSEGGTAELVEGNLIYGNGTAGISVRGELSQIGSIRKNTVEGNASAGILVEGSAAEIRNNIINRNSGSGIANTGRASVIANNLIAVNERAGLEDSTGADEVVNNIFYFNSNAAVRGIPASASNNNLYGNNETQCESEAPWCQKPQYGGNDGGEGDVYADPLFVDFEGEDFRLFKNSPCIDRGDPEILDLDGGRSDIGPFGGPDPMPGSGADDIQDNAQQEHGSQPSPPDSHDSLGGAQ